MSDRISITASELADQLFQFNGLICGASDSRVADAACELDLSFSQLRILWALSPEGEELTLGELAEAISLSVAAAGRAADVLARSGLVLRREDEFDRRVKKITLSDVGRRTLNQMLEARRVNMLQFAESLAAEDREALSAALTPILVRD